MKLFTLSMPSVNALTIRRWIMRVISAFVLLTVLFWGACHIWVPGAIKEAVGDYGKKIAYDISYQDLSISPLRLRLEIDGLRITDQRGSHLLELKKSIVQLQWSRLLLGQIGFDEILFEEPSLLLEKRSVGGKAGQWNWQEFITSIAKNLPPSDPEKPAQALKISVDEFKVSKAALLVNDAVAKQREEFKPFSIDLLNIANYDQGGEVNGLRGEYGLNLGALRFTVPGLNKRIAFQQLTVKGVLDNSGEGVLGAQVDLGVDDGHIRSHWDLKSDQSIAGTIKIENLSIAPIIGLLPANKELQTKSGILEADLAVQFKPELLDVSGDLRFQDVDIWEAGQKQALLAWKSGDLKQLSFTSSPKSGANLGMKEFVIYQPVLRFEIDEGGFSNFRRLFSKPDVVAEDATATPAPEAKVKEQSRFRFDLQAVRLRDGEMFFSDLAMRPNFHIDIRRLNAAVLGVSNTAGKFASIDIDGLVAKSGSMRAKGRAAFDDPRRNNDLSMNFKNMPLNAFNPAVMTFAGYQIASGRLNLNLNYQAKDGDLKGSNQIIIKNIELGEEVPDFKGKKLPLGLAIALLEDSDNTIDVTINIAGNVDSPEFSASGLVWQAIANVLTNVATAPFRALGSLLGMGANDGVNALPGEVVYLPPDQDRLEKFADYLAKRPHASIELAGTYDSTQDRSAFARATADRAILLASGMKFKVNEPIPSPDLSDPKVQSGLSTAYIQYVGRIKLGQRLLTLPAGPERNQQLYKELLESIPVTDADLKALATGRAKLALDLMTKDNPGLKERISLGEVKTVSAGKEGIPLEVEVRIK